MDLRLYNPTGEVEPDSFSEYTTQARVDDTIAKGIEVIGGKVVKYLLTGKGSDAFNPEYGGTALHHQQISRQHIPKLRLELLNDLRNCRKFIQDTEKDVHGERLSLLNLLNVRYREDLTPTRVDVHIEVITNRNNRAVVALGGWYRG